MEKIECTVFEGYAITLIVDPTKNYAETLLEILKHSRDSRAILSVKLCVDDNIIVFCLENERDIIMSWLSRFGKIDSIYRDIIYQPTPIKYDIDKYYDCIVAPVFF